MAGSLNMALIENLMQLSHQELEQIWGPECRRQAIPRKVETIK
jgi:hypothetical protein